MAKITAWLVTVIGIILILPLITIDLDKILFAGFNSWIIALAVLIIGVAKLIRNYSGKRR
jgi:hypothetical protein